MERARSFRQMLALAAIAALLPWPSVAMLGAGVAQAASVSSAAFSGGGSVNVGGTVFAKQGQVLTLTVVTSSDTRCVTVTGASTLPRQTSSTAKSNWTFTTTAPAGNGAQAFTVAASPNFNSNNCSGQTETRQASYTLDNTGPAVSADLAPAANTFGWNNSDVTARWAATDSGSGVAETQPFATETVTKNGIVTLTAPAQADRLGNTGAAGTVTVRVDKAKPTISETQTKNADGTTTVTFTCSDSNSGGGESSGISTCVADGTTSNSKTVKAGETVTGTATDRAGNTSTTTSTAPPSDATPPTINSAVAPAPNTAGWNKADATVTFSCSDNTGGSGVKTCLADGTSPASASKTVTTETNGTVVGGTATDNAGNVAKRDVTVKLDKTAPTAAATRTPAAGNANGWNNTDVTVSFACTDAGAQASGVKSCPAAKVLSDDGANQSASGAATDNADNTGTTATVAGINIDKTRPELSGAPTSAPNGNGWYTGDVVVKWTADDTTSGLASGVPANDTITGEGEGLKASATVTDKAGNATSADSPAVRIDRAAPTTGISGTSNNWTNGVVNVALAATDNLSGVASTTYSIDGGANQTGSSFTLSAEGVHNLTYFSTDNAGNAEAAKTAKIRIDKTAPTIGHTFAPESYKDGAWTNGDVEVTFDCDDQGGSGVATCTAPVTKSGEGKGQQVVGTVTDHAGNSATDTAVVSIDKTAPTITGSTDRTANDAGWFDDDVTVSFVAADALSGVETSSASKVLGEGADQSVTGTATDAAGNTASDTVKGINVDKTAPVLSGTFPVGWHKGDVTVNWSCTDTPSGVANGPANDTVTGEGANLSSTRTCTDKAGNTAAETVGGIKIDRTAPATGVTVSGPSKAGWYTGGVSVELAASDNLSGVDKTYYTVDGGEAKGYTGAVAVEGDGTHTVSFWSTDVAGNVEDKTGNTVTLKLDKTPPALSGEPTTSPNADGWYKGDVTVAWTCSDATSGIDGDCPAASTVGGEGRNLSAAASVSDKAGNATRTTVDGIDIDRTAPTTTADVPAVPAGGWYAADVQVKLNGNDNLSGVAATHYSIDEGAPQKYDGPFTVGAEGKHQITFWSTDKAGNVETVGAPIALQIDKTAPTTRVINPISPESGWFVTSGIPFAFEAADTHSGVAATYYTIDGGEALEYGKPFTKDLSTGTHTVTYWSVDIAGNKEAVRSLTLKVDTIAPAIKGAQSPQPNSFGWNNTDVDVKFTCTDADSGINGVAGCAGDTKLGNEAAGQKVVGDAVDVAGNRSNTEYGPVNIDKTAPTLIGETTTEPNAERWYKGDVTVKWTGRDALSGIDTGTQPADTVVTGEGASLAAGPVKISDKAGNVSAPASVTGLKIDRTPPSISGAPTTQPNSNGWYKGPVTVKFDCADLLSGCASTLTDETLLGNGANQSVTSQPVKDVAGNETPGKTVGAISIDGAPPQSSADNKCEGKNGWCKGQKATVILTAADQAGLSGVQEIHYIVNGGAAKSAAGSSVEVDVPLAAKSGMATVEYWAADKAGNVESRNGVSLKYDNIAPTVTHTKDPNPNAAGWNSSAVKVHFDAKDDDGGSGVDASTVTPDVLVSEETLASGKVIAGSAADNVGNIGTDSATIKLDKTAPTITGAVVSGTKAPNGWYTSAVKVEFTCVDGLSQVAECPAPVTLTADGADQSLKGTATDVAGNTASATVSGISIDSAKPDVTVAGVKTGGIYTLGAVPAATCSATDIISGSVDCKVTTTGGKVNGVGTFTYTATAKDAAGNTETVTGSYKVIYRWDGFRQPINDTAHQVGVSTSVFKGGSTVPAKFQLKKADGSLVQATTAPLWIGATKGSATSAPVDESAYLDAPTAGGLYRFEAADSQYIYNWGSPKAGTGFYHRIGVTLDDGQTYHVNIGLR